MISDTPDAKIELRPASPSSLNFTESILGIQGKREASSEWQEFLEKLQVNVLLADSSTSPPILAFVNERFELSKTFDEIKENGDLPKGFERIIQQHFDRNPIGKNEVILNTHHRIISKALKQGVNSPMANVLRVLVAASLTKAGAKLESDALAYQATDLSNIADALDS
jgi:hypothetical protein